MTRFLLYSHDTYGLGHLRRSILLANAIVAADQGHEVLIATGSPLAQAFSLPDRVDSLKLPSATKDGAGAYQPRKLGGSIRQLIELRSALLLVAIDNYAPEVILVDHAPLGMAGELTPVLDRYANRNDGPRLVLGLRDVIDDASQVDREWHRTGVWERLDGFDDILVYGDPRILTTAAELDLASRTSAVVSYMGYVAPTMPEPSVGGEPFLLVTPGGGGDGQAMLRRYLTAVEAGATGGLRSVIVTGPLLSSTRRHELVDRAQKSPSVEIIEFSHDLRALIASATGVISMAGYNTVVEELAAEVPALLVPRRWPRLEQHIRASRIAQQTPLEHCPIECLDSDRIDRFATTASRPSEETQQCLSIKLGGASTVAAILGRPQRNLNLPARDCAPIGATP